MVWILGYRTEQTLIEEQALTLGFNNNDNL